jgi:hypothetical protein
MGRMKDIAIGQQESRQNPEMFPPTNEDYISMLFAIIAVSRQASRDSKSRDTTL